MKYLNQVYLKKIREHIHDYALVRREIINVSGNALHHSKRIIFSLHRGDEATAKESLDQVESILLTLYKKYQKYFDKVDEGAYKAALEEYTEANLFYQYIKKGKIEQIVKIKISPETYVAGLCDLVGEVYRLAVRSSMNKNWQNIVKHQEFVDEVIAALTEIDLTSYLRTKFDQAKQAAQKMESLISEIALRGIEFRSK